MKKVIALAFAAGLAAAAPANAQSAALTGFGGLGAGASVGAIVMGAMVTVIVGQAIADADSATTTE